MWGAIIGDMVGAPYEWDRIKTTRFPLFKKESFPTDDSILTCAVAMAIARDYQNPDFDGYLRKFTANYPGFGYGSGFMQWAAGLLDRPSYGNGAAMRVSAVGWAYHSVDMVREMAKRSALPSHGHPEGIKGAQSVAEAIFLLRNGATKEAVRKGVQERYGYNILPVDVIRPTYEFNETCQETVPQAFSCLFESTDYEETIRVAVSLGGDSDTLACIAGSMAEAIYPIPAEILTHAKTTLHKELPQIASIADTFEEAIRKKKYQCSVGTKAWFGHCATGNRVS